MEEAVRYRPHRGRLDESLAEMVEIEGTRAALIDQIRKELERWPSFRDFPDDALHVDHYCEGDPRIGWDQVWIVTLDGYGVLGFCDGQAA